MDEMTFAKSGSVWYEQVDTSLVNLLSTKIQILDENDTLVYVKAMVRNPDTDILGNYPCITLSHYNEMFNVDRDGRDRFVSAIDTITGKVTYEYPAQPYDLSYQIDLWAEYEIDINRMSMQFISLMGEDYVLDVVDNLGNSRLSAMHKTDYANVDYIEEETNRRVFHRVYTYIIQVELDEKLPEIMMSVTDISIDLSKL